MAALTRSVGVVLLPILVFCTALWVKESFRTRCAAVAAALLPGMGVFALYIGGFYFAHGQYLGLTDMSGWNLYARVAPFADCGKFTPPEGTAILCEERPPSKRPGPFGYVWDLESVPRKRFELGPKTGRKLGEFAKRAIIHQPWEYARSVLIDLVKFIDPAIAPRRPYDGQPREILSFGWRDTTIEERRGSSHVTFIQRNARSSALAIPTGVLPESFASQWLDSGGASCSHLHGIS